MFNYKLISSLALVVSLGTGTGCHKKNSNGGGSSGGGTPPVQTNPNQYNGNPGKLGGTWSGQNSKGGNFSMTIEKGMIKNLSTSMLAASGVQAQGQEVHIQQYEQSIPIEASSGKFEGFIGDYLVRGEFVTDQSSKGEIIAYTNPVNGAIPEATWTAGLDIAAPDTQFAKVEFLKTYGSGLIDVTVGQNTVMICGEEEFLCNASYPVGTQVTLTPRSLNPLYHFNTWDPNGDCASAGSGACSIKLDASKYLVAEFKPVNVDGTYRGTTSQGKPITISINGNTVRAQTQIEMGINNCVFNFDMASSDELFYSSLFGGLLFFIDNQSDSVSGVVTSPNSISEGLIFYDSYGRTADPNCQDFRSLTFSCGSGIASASSISQSDAQSRIGKIRQEVEKHKNR